jgi:hypothetical protein
VRRAVAVLAVALVLAGCSGGSDDAAPKPKPSTTTTTAPAPHERWVLPAQFIGRYNLDTTLDPARDRFVAELRRTAPGTDGGAGIGASASTTRWRGKRVTFEADLKVVGSGRAGLYLQVSSAGSPAPTTVQTPDAELLTAGGWHRRSLQLDIPKDATLITYGVALEGGGSVLIDHVKAP